MIIFLIRFAMLVSFIGLSEKNFAQKFPVNLPVMMNELWTSSVEKRAEFFNLDFFRKPNNLVFLVPAKTNLYRKDMTDIDDSSTFKSVIKQLISNIWVSQNPDRIGSYVFVVNDRGGVALRTAIKDARQDLVEDFSNEFVSQAENSGEDSSPATVQTQANRFMNKVYFVHDPESIAWKLLPTKGVPSTSPAILIFNEKGVLHSSETELLPDAIYSQRAKDGIFSGAEVLASRLYSTLE